MKNLIKLLLITLIPLGLSAQEPDPIAVFVSDYTQDGRINDRDTIMVYIPGIFDDILKEEWELDKIDLSINDTSLDEITPKRIARELTYELDGDEVTVSTDILAFVVKKELLDRERLDALRKLEKSKAAFVVVRLPNDAEKTGQFQVIKITRTSYHKLGSWIVVILIAGFLIYVGLKTPALKDQSSNANKPFSFSRSQIFWWSLIILSSLFYVLISTSAFSINETAWILLGISAGTRGVGGIIDNSQINKVGAANTHQNTASEGWLKDILSDQNGISIHRVQAFLFNVGFGIYYLTEVYVTLEIPSFDANTLTLLGLSNGAYAVVKNNEN